ncbi:MAG: hypothetical protein OHK006_19020 [Thermodesulfovibrionales bacterium]
MLLVLWMLLTLALSVLPVSGPSLAENQDKAGHFVMYGAGAVLFLRSFSGRLSPLRAQTAAVLAAALYGCVMEFLQSFIPFRQASLADLLSNAAGALLFCIIYARWKRHKA